MSMHLQKFVDRVRGYEARGAKDFIMTMAEAKDMHADITRLLLELNDLRSRVNKSTTEEVITVQVGGGSF
jgi:hypothetical protein